MQGNTLALIGSENPIQEIISGNIMELLLTFLVVLMGL